MREIDIGKKVLWELNNSGYEGFFVGGVVRDIILNKKINDIDIATNATPDKVMKLFKRTIPTGIKHGTVMVIFEDISFEVTTFRSDGKYLDFRHPDQVKFVPSLKEDLSRRDFTINAIAMDIEEKIIDPFEGREAIFNKTIKTVGNSKDRFLEDPLRMLRAIRFAAQLNFSIDELTWEEIKSTSSYIQYISNERVKSEFDKIMQADYAHAGIELIYKSKLIDWIDGLNRTFLSKLDYVNIAQMVKRTNEPSVRWFLLLYSIENDERQIIMNLLKFSNKEKHKINSINFAYQTLSSDINILNIKRCLIETSDEICLMTINILFILNKIKESEMFFWISELNKIKDELKVRNINELDINGKDLIKAFDLSGGPWLNSLLKELFKKVVYDNIPNEKSVLIEQAFLIKGEEKNEA